MDKLCFMSIMILSPKGACPCAHGCQALRHGGAVAQRYHGSGAHSGLPNGRQRVNSNAFTMFMGPLCHFDV